MSNIIPASDHPYFATGRKGRKVGAFTFRTLEIAEHECKKLTADGWDITGPIKRKQSGDLQSQCSRGMALAGGNA